MTLWLIFALMTAAAIFAVLWPLARRETAGGGSDVAVYQDQLTEIERDRAAGLIGAPEADAAKIEVSRRLIAAADAALADKPASAASPLWRRRSTALAGLLLLPLGAVALYIVIGSPGLPGEPLAARLAASQGDRSIDSLIARVEKHLAEHPDDARGYRVLAPVYLRLGRFDDAVNARRRILAIEGDSADREADLGEALAAAANGIITAESKSAFDRALALDRTNAKARFFSGMAAAQDGDNAKAADIWNGMLADAPADAPWADTVREALAQIGAAAPQASAPAAAPPGPSAQDVAAAQGMSEKDRGDMIRGMVSRLADKLKEDGSDLEGWQRLLRAYVVLGERDKAVAAANDARHALAGDAEKLRRLEEAIKALGLGA
jgi:cytochrome c-type biogenesis protein CcmH